VYQIRQLNHCLTASSNFLQGKHKEVEEQCKRARARQKEKEDRRRKAIEFQEELERSRNSDVLQHSMSENDQDLQLQQDVAVAEHDDQVSSPANADNEQRSGSMFGFLSMSWWSKSLHSVGEHSEEAGEDGNGVKPLAAMHEAASSGLLSNSNMEGQGMAISSGYADAGHECEACKRPQPCECAHRVSRHSSDVDVTAHEADSSREPNKSTTPPECDFLEYVEICSVSDEESDAETTKGVVTYTCEEKDACQMGVVECVHNMEAVVGGAASGEDGSAQHVAIPTGPDGSQCGNNADIGAAHIE
jgi:hypothetical protein